MPITIATAKSHTNAIDRRLYLLCFPAINRKSSSHNGNDIYPVLNQISGVSTIEKIGKDQSTILSGRDRSVELIAMPLSMTGGRTRLGFPFCGTSTMSNGLRTGSSSCPDTTSTDIITNRRKYENRRTNIGEILTCQTQVRVTQLHLYALLTLTSIRYSIILTIPSVLTRCLIYLRSSHALSPTFLLSLRGENNARQVDTAHQPPVL